MGEANPKKFKVGRTKGIDDMEVRQKAVAMRAHMQRLGVTVGEGVGGGAGAGASGRTGFEGVEEVLSGEMEKRQVDAAFGLVRQRLGQVYKAKYPGVPL